MAFNIEPCQPDTSSVPSASDALGVNGQHLEIPLLRGPLFQTHRSLTPVGLVGAGADGPRQHRTGTLTRHCGPCNSSFLRSGPLDSLGFSSKPKSESRVTLQGDVGGCGPVRTPSSIVGISRIWGSPIATRHVHSDAAGTGPSCFSSNLSDTNNGFGTNCNSGIDDGLSTDDTFGTGGGVCNPDTEGRDTMRVGTSPRNPGATGPLACRRKGAATSYGSLFLILTGQGAARHSYGPSAGGQQGAIAIAAAGCPGPGHSGRGGSGGHRSNGRHSCPLWTCTYCPASYKRPTLTPQKLCGRPQLHCPLRLSATKGTTLCCPGATSICIPPPNSLVVDAANQNEC
nr:uncharacterized protein LOC103305964 [Chrysemys picta bellii]